MKGKPKFLDREITRLRSPYKEVTNNQPIITITTRINKSLNKALEKINKKTGIIKERIINDNLQEILINKYPELFKEKK